MAIALEIACLVGARCRRGEIEGAGLGIDAVDAVDPDIGQRQSRHRGVDQLNRVKALAVHAPVGTGEETLASQRQALASGDDGGAQLGGDVAEVEMLERRQRRVGDLGIERLAVAGGVVVGGAHRHEEIERDAQSQPVPARRVIAQAATEGGAIAQKRARLVGHGFVAQTQIGIGLAGNQRVQNVLRLDGGSGQQE